MSSGLGSTTINRLGMTNPEKNPAGNRWIAYGASKAALNMRKPSDFLTQTCQLMIKPLLQIACFCAAHLRQCLVHDLKDCRQRLTSSSLPAPVGASSCASSRT